MNIWNKVFLGIIFVTAITVLLLAGVEGNIRSKGQQHIAKLEKQIEEASTKIAAIVAGSDPKKTSVEKSPSELGLNELRGQSIERFDERGRAWFGCLVRSINEITLPPALTQVEAEVIITSPFMPNEAGTETDVVLPEALKGMVYIFEVFENKDENGAVNIEKAGKFLGRFNVSTLPTPTKFKDGDDNEKNGFTVTLITADPVSEKEIGQILDSRQSRWAIYLTPPVDRISGVLDQLSDDEKLLMISSLPASELSEEDKQRLLEEFKQKFPARQMPELTEAEKEGVDSQVAAMWEQYRQAMDDPEAELARDYAEALDWLYRRRSTLNREIAIAMSNIKTFETAVEKNQDENEKLENDCVLEEKRAEAMKIQGEHVKKLLDQYDTEINKMKLQIEKLQAMQTLIAAKIMEYQLKAVEKIEGQE